MFGGVPCELHLHRGCGKYGCQPHLGRRALRKGLQHRLLAMYFLRLLRRSMSDRCNHARSQYRASSVRYKRPHLPQRAVARTLATAEIQLLVCKSEIPQNASGHIVSPTRQAEGFCVNLGRLNLLSVLISAWLVPASGASWAMWHRAASLDPADLFSARNVALSRMAMHLLVSLKIKRFTSGITGYAFSESNSRACPELSPDSRAAFRISKSLVKLFGLFVVQSIKSCRLLRSPINHKTVP